MRRLLFVPIKVGAGLLLVVAIAAMILAFLLGETAAATATLVPNADNNVVTVKVEVRKADNTLVGSPTTVTLTQGATNYSYTVPSLALSATDVNGLYIQIVPNTISGENNTKVVVQTVNVDITYSQPTPTATATPTATLTRTPTATP